MAGTLLICRQNEKCGIVLSDRVNFETVVPLRDFVNNMPSEIKDLTVDLTDCISMDSTCMGVLSMLALTGMKSKLKMRVLNAGGNRQLLKGLGVDKLFKFEDGEFIPYEQIIYPAGQNTKDMQRSAETVLEAHETLISADDSNRQKFGTVVEMTRQDVERMKENNK